VVLPIKSDGSAGTVRVHCTVGLDDFAFDKDGNLYGTTDPFNTVVRIAPNCTVETLLTFADGLDGPSSAVFGVKHDTKTLYVANAAFPFFSGQTPRRPSVMRLDVGISGEPRR
jgi:sugar lactone lactonase YvrE